MATLTVPTKVTAEARNLARQYGVEAALDGILEQARQTVQGLQGLEVEAEPATDMGDRCIVIRAEIDPAFDDDPSHQAWWNWRIDQYGSAIAERFLVTTRLVDG